MLFSLIFILIFLYFFKKILLKIGFIEEMKTT